MFEFTFTFLYLGKILEGLRKWDTYPLKIFMVASKKAITICWLQMNPPTMKLFINSVRDMEKMTFTLRLQKDKGDKYWEKQDCHKHTFNIDFCMHCVLYLCLF